MPKDLTDTTASVTPKPARAAKGKWLLMDADALAGNNVYDEADDKKAIVKALRGIAVPPDGQPHRYAIAYVEHCTITVEARPVSRIAFGA